ncbi:hypothetical protein ABFS82_05G044300 [Erythranthe guttata]
MAEKKEEETRLLQGSSSPNEAIFFVLAYLPLFELLRVSRVCKSLRDAVNDDVLLWMKIVVDRRLMASRAKGRLQFLALVDCTNITDYGLLRVVAQNPHITKLHIPGCTNLSPAGIIESVKLLTNTNNSNHRLQSLRINGIHSIKKDDLETLENLMMINRTKKERNKIFYHENDAAIDRNSIDVEVCPKCEQMGIVFDCPRGCEYGCRGCEMCTRRCAECGICIRGDHDGELEEASCAYALCLKCWLTIPKCCFCSRAYCDEHACRQLHRVSDSSAGFVCGGCRSRNPFENPYMYF